MLEIYLALVYKLIFGEHEKAKGCGSGNGVAEMTTRFEGSIQTHTRPLSGLVATLNI